MYDKTKLAELAEAKDRWEETTLPRSLARTPERKDRFMTTSSEPIQRLYTPLDVADLATVYLGGFTFAQLQRAGLVQEVTPGAVARADAAFRSDRAPWCPEIF